MGMWPPSVPGQVQNVNRTPSTRGPPQHRRSSPAGSLSRKDLGLNQRVPSTQTGREPTLIQRKRLPWLDGNETSKPGQVPGAFESTRSLELATPQAGESMPVSGFAATASSTDAVPPGKRPSISSLYGDPSFRAVGSTPSLRQREKSLGRTRTLSLNSEPRPGVKPAMSKQQAKRALGVTSDKHTKAEEYTPSEYSTTVSSDADRMPTAMPKKDHATYQRLVQRAAARKQASHGPLHTQNWLQSQLDVPLSEVAPVSETRKCRRSDRLCSCESPFQDPSLEIPSAGVRPEPRRAASVSRLPVQSLPVPTPDSIIAPLPRSGTAAPKPADARKKTLHPMPSHLEGASSSSSMDIPPHLLPSTDVSSSSPNVSPRGTRKVPALPLRTATRDLRRSTQNLNQAVTGHENLMQEALDVAKDAAQSGRRDDVAAILDSATVALRKASTVIPPKRSGADHNRISDPLVLSPHESGISSASDTEEDMHSGISSVQHSREASMETAPTLVTRSAQSSKQPILVDGYGNEGMGPVSQRAVIDHAGSSDDESIAPTPPRLYQPPSADSIVRDFAYNKLRDAQRASLSAAANYGEAADFYNDHGESVPLQPGIRRSIALDKMPAYDKPLPDLPPSAHKPGRDTFGRTKRGMDEVPEASRHNRGFTKSELRALEHVPTDTVPPERVNSTDNTVPETMPQHRKRGRHGYLPHVSDFFENAYYRNPEGDSAAPARKISSVTDTRSVAPPPPPRLERVATTKSARKHISLREGQGFSLGRYHRRQPIAREWHTVRKRITAAIACANTVFIGLIAGIYAGEVPRMQYQIADTSHKVILGNVLLFAGLGLTTLIFWPLPLLHGRKPYTLMAFALMLPLQFPQALSVSAYRDPNKLIYRCGLLIPRIFTGIALGFANINQLPTLFDLFGCSLMSERPHQEIVVIDDVRRQGGGIGIWLGIWAFCFVGSLSIGFCIGACIISKLDPSWGFYLVVMLLAFFLLVNVIAPETRRAPYRRSIAHFFDEDDKLRRRVARGEVKLHISNDGPKWWFQEVWAGIILTKRMVFQLGFLVLMVYIAWIYAQVTLVILLLGALLSRDYQWQSQYVGLAALSLAIGAFLAIPLAKASVFSRARFTPQRTDSMTMRAPRLTWSSHLVRRCIFTLLLPFAGLAYTLSAPGPRLSWTSPTIFCGFVGFLSNLAIAECVGLIMDTFDTSDLQPGVNQKHRLQSMAETTRRRRTNYSSFPRVCAGFFAAQSLGFFLAAACTGVSGDITRALGAQEAVAIVAGILLVITLLFMIAMWRFREVQVIPSGVFGAATKRGSIAWGPGADDPEWKPVVIGNPSGKMRRINLLEMGDLTRWTEIRKLNKLVRK